MSSNPLGSLMSSIPFLGSLGSGGSAGSNPLGGLVNAVVAPIASVATAATKVVDQFIPAPVKSVLGAAEQALSPPGALPGGLRVEVNVLKSVVAMQNMDATSKDHIQSALDQVKSGVPLDSCLSSLSAQEKTKLADTIGNAGFEPPDALKSYLTDKSEGDSSRMDCALKNVEVAEKKGYSATEASSLFTLLPLAPMLLGG